MPRGSTWLPRLEELDLAGRGAADPGEGAPPRQEDQGGPEAGHSAGFIGGGAGVPFGGIRGPQNGGFPFGVPRALKGGSVKRNTPTWRSKRFAAQLNLLPRSHESHGDGPDSQTGTRHWKLPQCLFC